MKGDRYRIERSAAYHGRLVVQKWYPDNGVWADVGDACQTRSEAEAKLAAILAAEQQGGST